MINKLWYVKYSFLKFISQKSSISKTKIQTITLYFVKIQTKHRKKLLQHILQTVDLYKNKELEKSKEESSRAEEYNNWNLKYTRRNQ